jgi:hypothetical protein
MMPRKFNYERAATILAEAALIGDEKAADNHGTTVRSVQNWRAKLKSDPVLVEFFAAKTQAATTDWADDINDAIKAGVDFLRRAANQASPMHPDVIHAVAGAVKLLSEVQMTKRVLDARIAGANRPQHPEAGAMATAHRVARK